MAIPEFLIEKLEAQYGSELKDKIVEGFSPKRKVTFRVNTLKSTVEEIKGILKNENIEFEKVVWSDEAFILTNACEENIQKLEIYEQGKIYLQSLSSMLPPIVLKPEEGKDILDMAAAPGGKTTQMAALSNNKAHITACEMNNIRIEKLKYNVEKQGASCVYIMQKDSRQIDDFFSFDQILLDSPCSGSGTLNSEDANAEKYFTNKLIEKSTKSQYALLKKALKILKPGHKMVYSTCSILKEENEEIVRKVLKEAKAEIVPIEFEGIEDLPILPVSLDGTVCVAPTDLYEGFYIAKIRKLK
ncbi:MAG: RsmB/NOP family class I SAM-dependent RNA methyltransferase [Clostridia bacterium]|nr:RsmB/NOP family class I SAM-dependent RNA methyltransferase [Clostridia bacterium]